MLETEDWYHDYYDLRAPGKHYCRHCDETYNSMGAVMHLMREHGFDSVDITHLDV